MILDSGLLFIGPLPQIWPTQKILVCPVGIAYSPSCQLVSDFVKRLRAAVIILMAPDFTVLRSAYRVYH